MNHLRLSIKDKNKGSDWDKQIQNVLYVKPKIKHQESVFV